MNSLEIIYLSATILQIGATVFFILSARYLGISKINAFTIAFGLIVIRRVIVLFLNDYLPTGVQEVISYIDIFIFPILFSLLLFVGTVQFYVQLTKFFRK